MAKNLNPKDILMGEKRVQGLGGTVLSMMAVGLTAGLTLIAAAKRFGELIAEDTEDKDDSR